MLTLINKVEKDKISYNKCKNDKKIRNKMVKILIKLKLEIFLNLDLEIYLISKNVKV